MPEEARRFADRQLSHGLQGICRVQNPSVFFCEVESIPSLREGQFSFSHSGEIIAPRNVAELMAEDMRRLGIRVKFDFESDGADHTQDVKFTLQPTGQTTKLHRHVAPWYVEIYCKDPDIDPEVRRTLLTLKDIGENGEGQLIFRGESDLYSSVRSTLARHWNTDSPDALRIISKGNLNRARQYLQGVRPGELETSALVRHMGGVTNLVDFSTEIWIALFFACLDDRIPPRRYTRGRIYALDYSREYDDLEIHSLEHQASPVPQDRWQRQSGVVVIPIAGTISPNHLQEVVKITPESKRHLNEFLNRIDVSVRTLFNDLEGYIRYEQDYAPIEAICHMAMRLLGTGEQKRAFYFAESLIRLDNSVNSETGYYLRGLCFGFEGKLKQANQDIRKFIQMRGTVPEFVKENQKVLQQALLSNGNRDYGQKQRRRLRNLRKQIRLDLDKALWSITLQGEYTRVQR